MGIDRYKLPAGNRDWSKQGYDANTEKVDRDKLKLHWAALSLFPDQDSEEETKSFITGEDAANLKPKFDGVLSHYCETNYTNREMTFKSAPLKKGLRMYEKSVAYAVEGGKKDIDVTRIRDVLRGTIYFSNTNYLGNMCGTGDNIIDRVEREFKKHGEARVIQVKNRFNHAKPSFQKAMSSKTLEELLKFLKKHRVEASGFFGGRDYMYRDIQLLVYLPKGWGNVPMRLSHHVAEVQITIKEMLDTKGGGGHKVYKDVRKVLEMLEYKSVKAADGKVPLEMAKDFYDSQAPPAVRNAFPKNLFTMTNEYSKVGVNKLNQLGAIPKVIDNSTWYARASK